MYMRTIVLIKLFKFLTFKYSLHLLMPTQWVLDISSILNSRRQDKYVYTVWRETLAVENVGKFGERPWIHQIYSIQILYS